MNFGNHGPLNKHFLGQLLMIGIVRVEGISEAYVKELIYLLRGERKPYYLITEIRHPIRDERT